MTDSKIRTHGLYTATTTPLTADGHLNTSVIAKQIEAQLAAGVSGIVAVGGTGEGSALSLKERVQVVSATVEAVGGRVPVVAGVVRKEKTAGAGSEVDTVGILGIKIQAADVASIRTQGSPLACPEGSSRHQSNSQCDQCLTGNHPNRT